MSAPERPRDPSPPGALPAARFGLRKPSRRMVLSALGAAGAAGAGGLWLVVGRRGGGLWSRPVARAQPFSPSAFLAIASDGATTLWATKSEMGQGVFTALPLIVAEELDADWSRVRVEQAPLGDGHDYGSRFTAASASVISMWTELRRAGAAARTMLIGAAAARWGVGARDCVTEPGVVVHPSSGRRLDYGALAADAAAQPVPRRPRLKDPASFRLLGGRVPRLDLAAKVTGQTRFAADVRPPGLLHAVVARPDALGARPGAIDDGDARALPGVIAVVPLPDGVGVVARDTWTALRAREALRVEWSPGVEPALDDEAAWARARAQLERPGARAREEGDVDSRLRDAPAARLREASFAFPYLAHATMEPPACTAHVEPGRCTVWAATQDPDAARARAAEAAGLPVEAVLLHTTFLGGGFGRKTQPDEVAHAVALSRATGAPVQVQWTRQDDLRHDHYRELSLHRLRAALGPDGRPLAWHHRLVSPSISKVSSEAGQVDGIATGGATDWPYDIPHIRVEWGHVPLPVPVGIWRGVGYTYNTFAVECFLDELAEAGGQDPLALRLALLARAPRLRRCVERVGQLARWRTPRPAGRALGLSAVSCFGSHIAQVAEVELDPRGAPRVTALWSAVDCGIVVNRDTVEAQIEGACAFALSAALRGRITLRDGGVAESNFHDYPLLRLPEMPAVHTELLSSGDPPSGVGELGVPAVAPAVANALFRLTGRRVRALPIAA